MTRTHAGDRFLCIDGTKRHDWWTVGCSSNVDPTLTFLHQCARCGLVLILDEDDDR